MEKPKFLKVENDESWVRDVSSGALVRVNRDPHYNEIQRKRKELIDKKISEQIIREEINTLKEDILEIKSLLKVLIGNK